MHFIICRFIRALLPNYHLRQAVQSGNEASARQALQDGADANLRLLRSDGMPHGIPLAGGWRLVDEGDILGLAMTLGHDHIGLLLADAGARVPAHHHERIVSQRWKARLAHGGSA